MGYKDTCESPTHGIDGICEDKDCYLHIKELKVLCPHCGIVNVPKELWPNFIGQPSPTKVMTCPECYEEVRRLV